MNKTPLFWYLKNVDLFQGLNEADLTEVASIVNTRTCRKKQLLYTPHDEPDEIYILKKGEITLYTSNNGNRLVLDVLGPNSIFGRLSPQAPIAGHFAEVTEEAYICVMPVQQFSGLIGKKPQILINLLNILAGQLNDCQSRLMTSHMSASEKVLACLKARESRGGSRLAEWFPHRRLTHARIAEQTGLSRETVSRTISRLRKEKKL